MPVPTTSFLEAAPLDDDSPTLRMSRDAFSDATPVADRIDDVDGASPFAGERRSEEP